MQFSILLAISSLFSFLSVTAAYPNPISGSSSVVVRDPAIWYNSASKKYFVFSTGGGIKIFTAPALTGPWTNVGYVLPNCSVINNPGRCSLWAPSISYVNGKYALYYSTSELGSQNSAIGVATSPSMEPGTWTDLGAVVTSKAGDVYNAIDPDLIDDNGLKLSFGSYWNGIYQIGIWPDVNNPASATPGTHLAGGNGRAAEGGTTYKSSNSSYWFFLFSDGKTILEGATTRPPAGEEYKVLVGRGSSGMGPFYGKLGNALTETLTPPTGSLVLPSHDNIYAPGGQSLFKDPVSGRDVIVYHYVPNNAFGGPSYLGINYIDFSSGWPVVV
ncbi:glycoside hydrolase family 43 protein [Flagelloscypha sp. PMI_526]|nr:glycoside hydrolase family 43 protein [Flagelloscypha sp. PMI_526]